MEDVIIESIFATSVEAYVFDSFTTVNAGYPKRSELDTYSLYRYLLLNAKQMLNETDFNTAHASYLALDYNMNDPEVCEKLQEKNKEITLIGTKPEIEKARKEILSFFEEPNRKEEFNFNISLFLAPFNFKQHLLSVKQNL